jgi:hypothetical protein
VAEQDDAPLSFDDGIEQPRRGKGGRNPGSRNILSKESIRKLEMLGFDPIESAVRLYEQLAADAYFIKHDDEGNVRTRYNVLAYSNLITAMAKINADLLRYRYGRVSEAEEKDTEKLPPLVIKMTGQGDVFLGGPEKEDEAPFKGPSE